MMLFAYCEMGLKALYLLKPSGNLQLRGGLEEKLPFPGEMIRWRKVALWPISGRENSRLANKGEDGFQGAAAGQVLTNSKP